MSAMDKARAYLADRFPLINELLTTRLKTTLAAAAALFLALAIASYADLILTSEDLFTKAGPIIGGDFIVFNHAARVAGTPDMIAIYDMANLKAALQATYPGKGEFNLAWMYPPTMSLLIAPFGAPPYLVSFTLWIAIFGAFFIVVLSRLWADKWALFFAVSAPATFQAVITGQNGFLTASLIALAGAFADKRPIVAGLAAGLLTVKPQLGLLIPIAFIAGGCWRAFFVAAATATLLAAASYFAYGADAWVGFVESVAAHSARMGQIGFPYHKLVTPYGFASMLGAPSSAAGAVQSAASIALAAYVFIIWRRVKDWDLRLAALSTAAMLATPYAFYYEIVILTPAMFVIARRAVQTGWLPHERLALLLVWIAPLMMPGPEKAIASICALGAFTAFLIAARRTLAAAGFMFAIEAKPAPAGS